MGNIRSFRELKVWNRSIDAAMEVFRLTKEFPASERYALIDQIRRSSRSVPSNIAEAWRKRRSASPRPRVSASSFAIRLTQLLIWNLHNTKTVSAWTLTSSAPDSAPRWADFSPRSRRASSMRTARLPSRARSCPACRPR
ncbi:MAG: four helix bundle protein [Verrucomicrobiota bacterium]